MIEKFTVFAYDINSNERITEFPAKQLTFDSRLNDPGSITFTCYMRAPKVANLVAPILDYGGDPVKLYVDRNGVIVWSGFLWTVNPTKSTGEIEFGGGELLSWGDMRVQAADYSASSYPNGIDAGTLMAKVFTDAQDTTLCGPGASIGLNIVGATAGINIVPGYPLSQYTQLSQIVANTVQVVNPGVGGIDVGTASYWDPTTGAPVDTLTVYCPRIGRPAGQTGVIFDLSAALDYTWPTDATKSGNTLIVMGGSSTNTPIAIVNTPGVTVGGAGEPPRLDLVASYTTVTSQDQISLMANGAADQYGKPILTPTVTVPTASNLGTFIVGDDARLYSPPDFLNPRGVDQYLRIVQSQVTVPDDGGSATMVVTFNPPPSF